MGDGSKSKKAFNYDRFKEVTQIFFKENATKCPICVVEEGPKRAPIIYDGTFCTKHRHFFHEAKALYTVFEEFAGGKAYSEWFKRKDTVPQFCDSCFLSKGTCRSKCTYPWAKFVMGVLACLRRRADWVSRSEVMGLFIDPNEPLGLFEPFQQTMPLWCLIWDFIVNDLKYDHRGAEFPPEIDPAANNGHFHFHEPDYEVKGFHFGPPARDLSSFPRIGVNPSDPVVVPCVPSGEKNANDFRKLLDEYGILNARQTPGEFLKSEKFLRFVEENGFQREEFTGVSVPLVSNPEPLSERHFNAKVRLSKPSNIRTAGKVATPTKPSRVSPRKKKQPQPNRATGCRLAPKLAKVTKPYRPAPVVKTKSTQKSNLPVKSDKTNEAVDEETYGLSQLPLSDILGAFENY
ncbi:hypothetical protein TWF173_002067 [Orbilia oligospora]|nr:hypothetical protein TWF173_002067 [Orbilia oligospora]